MVGQRELPQWAQDAGPWIGMIGQIAPVIVAGAVLFVGQRLSEASDKVHARLETIEKTLALTCAALERNTNADDLADQQLVEVRNEVTRITAKLGID